MAGYLIPVCIHIFCYSRILRVLLDKSVSITPTKKRAQRRMAKLGMVIVAFFFINLSWNMNWLLLSHFGVPLDHQSWHYNMSLLLDYMNFFVNFIIYLVFFKDYRQQMRVLFSKCFNCFRKGVTASTTNDVVDDGECHTFGVHVWYGNSDCHSSFLPQTAHKNNLHASCFYDLSEARKMLKGSNSL